MCANYKTIKRSLFESHFGFAPGFVDEDVRSEVYPGGLAPFVRLSRESEKMECKLGGFGLMPHWAKPALFRQTYNARSETVVDKPSYRNAWKKAQHCIIPAEWIYEPLWQSGKAVRWKIAHRAGRMMGIAGLWEWRPGKDELQTEGLLSFTMLTVNATAHAMMGAFHRPDDEKRMVVFLEPSQYESWLRASPDHAMAFMTQYPAEQLVAEAAPRPPKGSGEREDLAA